MHDGVTDRGLISGFPALSFTYVMCPFLAFFSVIKFLHVKRRNHATLLIVDQKALDCLK